MELLQNKFISNPTLHKRSSLSSNHYYSKTKTTTSKSVKLFLKYFKNILDSKNNNSYKQQQKNQSFLLNNIHQFSTSDWTNILTKNNMAETIPKLDSIAQLSESSEVRRFGPNSLSSFLLKNNSNSNSLNSSNSSNSSNFYPLSELQIQNTNIVQNNTKDFIPIRSLYPVSLSFTYYEVTLHTSGTNRIGWCSNLSEFNKYQTVGDDEFSIGFDSSISGSFWNEKNCYNIKNIKQWQIGDIIGCGIDVYNRKLFFSLNGKFIHKKRLSKFDFSSQSYFAAISVGSGQKLQINFGEKPFIYLPENLSSFNILEEFQSKNRLLEPILTYGTYWFKNNEICNDFNDYKQNNYIQWITDLELRIQVEDFDREFFQNDFRWQLEFLIKQNRGCERFIFEIIRSLGQLVSQDKLNIVTSWLIHYLCIFDKIFGQDEHDNVAEIRYMDRIQFDSEGNSFTVPSLAKFFELLYPFMFFNSNNHHEYQRIIRNTCIVFNILASKYQQIPDFFNNDLAKFYLDILNNSSDSSTILYALTALEYYQIDQELKKIFRDSIERIFELTSNHDENDLITQEIHFVADWCLNRLFCEYSTIISSKSYLDHLTATEGIKLGYNEARSDHGWQSVRSKKNVTSGVYYYEVTLLTSGSMRIGWATDECDFTKTIVGDDAESVGIDMYRRNVFNSTKFKLRNAQQRVWRSGDVVGCRINIEQQKFQFYLNGELIESKKSFFKKIAFSSSRLYWPAVTISPFQHVRFNFGEMPFRYLPTQTK